MGEFVGDGFALKFDFGEYSNPLKEEKKPAYVIVHKSIAGLPSKVVSPKAPATESRAFISRERSAATSSPCSDKISALRKRNWR